MQQSNTTLSWLKENREMAIEALRIYLGIALFVKGIQFMVNKEQAAEYLGQVTIPFFEFLSVHVIAMVHIAGGFLMAIGLITRVAAVIQIPILLGAIFFVHFQQGLFRKAQDLEYVILVLVLLIIFVIYGSGRLSVDYLIASRLKKKR
jgi:uncharacterized membrane protein YphA (DoxX/SURF4 family)